MYRRQPPRRHACTRCVQLKVRCVPVTDLTTCERCVRLGLKCAFPDNLRGNKPRRSRIDVLQEQVNNLAAQLDKSSHSKSIHEPAAETSDNSSSPATPASLRPHAQSDQPDDPAREPNEGDVLISCGPITFREADELLTKFRDQKMVHFPFIIIPHQVNALYLHLQSPFLLLCIITACLEHNPTLQDQLEQEVRKTIAARLIVGLERNMDLLQGLLVHTAWHHYHWRTYHTQLYMLLQITIMVVVDLGLDRSENFRMQAIPLEGQEPDQNQGTVYHQIPAGQRALLGCYYLCSKSSIFRQQLIMRHTEWIDQCAKSLALKAEYPTDSILMGYTDIQSLVHRSQIILDEGTSNSSSHLRQMAWVRVFDLMKRQQEDGERPLSHPSLENNWALRLELSAAPILVLGHSLRRQGDVFYLHEMGQIQNITSSAHRLVATFLACPSTVAVCLPATSYTTLWYGLLLLSKLSLLFGIDAARRLGVDTKRIHNTGLAIIEKMGELSLGNDVWNNSKKVIGSMLSWLEKSKIETKRSSSDCSDSVSLITNVTGHVAAPRPFDPPNPVSSRQQLSSLENGYTYPDTGPLTAFSGPQHPAIFADGQIQIDWDASLWEQMLEGLPWVGPPMESQFGFQ